MELIDIIQAAFTFVLTLLVGLAGWNARRTISDQDKLRDALTLLAARVQGLESEDKSTADKLAPLPTLAERVSKIEARLDVGDARQESLATREDVLGLKSDIQKILAREMEPIKGTTSGLQHSLKNLEHRVDRLEGTPKT